MRLQGKGGFDKQQGGEEATSHQQQAALERQDDGHQPPAEKVFARPFSPALSLTTPQLTNYRVCAWTSLHSASPMSMYHQGLALRMPCHTHQPPPISGQRGTEMGKAMCGHQDGNRWACAQLLPQPDNFNKSLICINGAGTARCRGFTLYLVS